MHEKTQPQTHTWHTHTHTRNESRKTWLKDNSKHACFDNAANITTFWTVNSHMLKQEKKLTRTHALSHTHTHTLCNTNTRLTQPLVIEDTETPTQQLKRYTNTCSLTHHLSYTNETNNWRYNCVNGQSLHFRQQHKTNRKIDVHEKNPNQLHKWNKQLKTHNRKVSERSSLHFRQQHKKKQRSMSTRKTESNGSNGNFQGSKCRISDGGGGLPERGAAIFLHRMVSHDEPRQVLWDESFPMPCSRPIPAVLFIFERAWQLRRRRLSYREISRPWFETAPVWNLQMFEIPT